MKNLFALLVTTLLFTGLHAQTPELWGMTNYGGVNNGGIIFKTDTSGNNQNLVHTFNKASGRNPYGSLIKASNGKIYGTTSWGPAVLFEFDPLTELYTVKYEFTDFSGSANHSSVFEASNGKIYGMTESGGVNNMGYIFEFDLATDTYTKKFDFDGTNGSKPQGELMEATNGKLYGMTYLGGINNNGVIFEFDFITSTYTKKVDFDGAVKGGAPKGALMEAANGNFYGMTMVGGINNMGVFFEYNLSTSTYTKILDFDGAGNGKRPEGALMEASNGKLYGMTAEGGNFDLGVIFEYDYVNEVYLKVYNFGGSYRNPLGTLVEAANGKLYGLTVEYLYGYLFEFNIPSSSITFGLPFDGTDKGHDPYGSLIKSSDGLLYGLTYGGGMLNWGVLFQFDPSNLEYNKLFDFMNSPEGGNPTGALVEATNKKFYGITSQGGINNMGVLFEYDPISDVYLKKFDFDGINTGNGPQRSLIEASNGKLYGMTNSGGINNMGVIFEFDPTNSTFTKKMDFDGTTKGRLPRGSLLEASNGKLYGMTNYGGTNNFGVIFEFDISTDTYSKKMDFDGVNSGRLPEGALMEASNGKLYGMTTQGGVNNNGVMFEFNPITNAFVKKFDFSSAASGNYPRSFLLEASNNKLYGMTYYGGTNNIGVLFEYELSTETFTKKVDFDGINNGKNPLGGLMESSNGKLYGMTSQGGINNFGVLFEFNPSNDTYTKKIDFDGSNGSGPYSNLIEIWVCLETFSTINPVSCNSYISPSGNYTWTSSGNYLDTIPNAAGCDSVITIELTINYSNTGTDIQTDCDSYLWIDGITYTASNNTATHTLVNAAGCDSVVTLNLTINNAATPLITPAGNVDICSGDSITLSVSNSQANANYCFYKTPQSLAWQNVGTAGFSADWADNTSLAFDGTSTPYVAYADMTVSDKATVMKYNSSSWVTVGTAGFSAGAAYSTSLAFDGTGTPFVAYRDMANSGKATVMKYDGSSWVTLGTAGFSAGGTSYTSLAFNGTGTPYVAFRDWANSDKATVMKYDGSSWITEGTAGFSAGGASNTSLAFDGTGSPYVAFRDVFNSDKATVMNFDGSNWVSLGTAGFSSGVADFTNLAFDGTGIPYVAYADLANSYKATVMKYVGSSWVTVGTAGFSAGDAYYTSLAFDGTGTPHVAYLDGGNGYKATVMKYPPSCNSNADTLLVNAHGTYEVIITDSNGCTAVSAPVVVDTLSHTTGTDLQTACDSYTWIDGNTYTASNNSAIHTLTNAAGCDSLVTLDLTINSSTFGSETIIACGSYTWPANGTTYVSGGSYTAILTNASGCDSTVTLNLSINTVDASVATSGITITANSSQATYQWIDCINGNIPLIGEINQSFTPAVNGEYAVIVTNATTNSCSDTSACVTISTVGMNESNLSGSSINLYPNPNNGSFSIETTEVIKIEIFNTIGQSILTKTLNPGKNKIGMEKEGNGVYFISYTDKKGNRINQKLIITR